MGSSKWIKLERGIRCREHPTRRHGVRSDRYFVLRFSVDGEMVQEALGWASEGITLEKARVELAKLKEAKRTGLGSKTMRERREQEKAQRDRQEREAQQAKFRAITCEVFWRDSYWPCQTHKAKGSLDAEQALWAKWLAPVLGDIPLYQIGIPDLEMVKQRMIKADLSPATIKYAMALFSQLWTLAVTHGVLEGPCPTKQIKLPKRDNQRQRFLSPDEAKQLLDTLRQRSKRTHDMALFALQCGLRFGEIAKLRWEDLDLNNKTILIRDPKSRRNRHAIITDTLLKVIEERRPPRPAGLIFPDHEGKPMARISKTFTRVANELFNKDVEDPRNRVCFHTLRHTFASSLVAAGGTLYLVQKLLGHSSIKMTERYAHLSSDNLRDLLNNVHK